MGQLSDPRTSQRLLSDKWWRLCNLYHIVDVNGNKIQFKPNWAQTAFYRSMWYLNIILKARQLGFTTFICIYLLDSCIFNSNTQAGIIAHNKLDAEEFFENKIKFAWDNLDPVIKATVTAKNDKAGKLSFSNGSSIRVGTSMRSGTVQILHISEFGKMCAKYPEKAREVITGALNAVHAGNFVFIESTAEGAAGRFHDMTMEAQRLRDMGVKLSELDYKFHFFPWWRHPEYTLRTNTTPISEQEHAYFDKLESGVGQKIMPGQRAWYAKKAVQQGDDMKREFPGTPQEAFEQSIEGAYYARQMTSVRKQGRITTLPWEPSLPVNVFFDIGVNDETALWFHQQTGGQHRFIHYYANSDEGAQHYCRYIKECEYTLGYIVMPHDIEVREWANNATKRIDVVRGLLPGVHIVTATNIPLQDGIETVRMFLPKCVFDAEGCKEGITCLDMYRKAWDDKRGIWKERPVHDEYSHGADSFRMGAVGLLQEFNIPGVGKNKVRNRARRRGGVMAV